MENTENSNFNSIGDFVEEIINEQGYGSLDEETKGNLKAEMVQRLMDQIDQAAINELSEAKAIELANKIDNGELNEDQIAQFMTDAGVDLQKITLTTMLQFRMLYQGGGTSDETVTPPVEEMKAKMGAEASEAGVVAGAGAGADNNNGENQ